MTTKRKSTKVAKKKEDGIRILNVPKNATMRQILAAHRKQFTAADLQKYTVIEEGVPIEKVIAQMEEIQRKYEAKRK